MHTSSFYIRDNRLTFDTSDPIMRTLQMIVCELLIATHILHKLRYSRRAQPTVIPINASMPNIYDLRDSFSPLDPFPSARFYWISFRIQQRPDPIYVHSPSALLNFTSIIFVTVFDPIVRNSFLTRHSLLDSIP